MRYLPHSVSSNTIKVVIILMLIIIYLLPVFNGSSCQSEDQVKGGFFLDVVVRQSLAIFKLLASKNQSLMIWGNPQLILDFGLDIFNGVRRFNLKANGLASERLDKDLHTPAKPQDQVQGRLLLDVVVAEGATILELLPGEDQTLLVRGDTFLILLRT